MQRQYKDNAKILPFFYHSHFRPGIKMRNPAVLDNANKLIWQRILFPSLNLTPSHFRPGIKIRNPAVLDNAKVGAQSSFISTKINPQVDFYNAMILDFLSLFSNKMQLMPKFH